jgi:hypothetical protein
VLYRYISSFASSGETDNGEFSLESALQLLESSAVCGINTRLGAAGLAL